MHVKRNYAFRDLANLSQWREADLDPEKKICIAEDSGLITFERKNGELSMEKKMIMAGDPDFEMCLRRLGTLITASNVWQLRNMMNTIRAFM